MKPTKLIIHNIGKIEHEEIAIDKPLILFYGEIKQGKTTILNSVRWVCGGEFPDDIIRHGQKEASIEFHFVGGMISRSFYRAKDQSVKSRPVVFVRDGRAVSSPVSEIKKLLNPFLLDQDFLRNKNELERKQYFTELFAVDTSELDTDLEYSQRDAQALRIKISGYGDIDLTKVEAVDTVELDGKLRRMKAAYASEKAELESQLQKIDVDYLAECQSIDVSNNGIREHNSKVDRASETKQDIENAIASHEKKLSELRLQLAAIVVPEKRELLIRPTVPDKTAIQQKILDIQPDTSSLEKQIQDAGATNVRAEQYQKNLKRDKERRNDEEKLSTLEKQNRDIKAKKLAKLKEVGDKSGIKGLEFEETGNFIYDGTSAGMISDSQIMRLSSELSALYPDGFGLDLIDRAESLGKSIFDFVDKAKAENKTILATIVGEKPAKLPDDVGVFVVENGKLI